MTKWCDKIEIFCVRSHAITKLSLQMVVLYWLVEGLKITPIRSYDPSYTPGFTHSKIIFNLNFEMESLTMKINDEKLRRNQNSLQCFCFHTSFYWIIWSAQFSIKISWLHCLRIHLAWTCCSTETRNFIRC